MGQMCGRQVLIGLTISIAMFTAGTPALAQQAPILDPIEVTTSKVPIELSDVAANVRVMSGEELRARGAIDLGSALSLIAGVDIAPGGDGGPASSVPALWGLREFDAFLLIVDGVPAGGAFTPALATLSMANVERIELLKGAAPVSYGATSFVGVIQVFHYAAGEGPARVEVGVGSRGSAIFAATIPLSDANDSWQESLLIDAQKRELETDRAGWDRTNLTYRGAGEIGAGRFNLDANVSILHQDPLSPVPREGSGLSDRVPINANINPSDARQDENRGQVALAYLLPTSLGDWNTQLAIANSSANDVRGFLREDFSDDGVTPNADGFDQDVHRTEIYFDTHVATPINDRSTLVWGLDHLYGNGYQESRNFEYAVFPDGSNPPPSGSRPIDETTRLDDKRNFTGLYADLEYAVTDAWRVEAGLRFNHTEESRSGRGVDLTGEEPVPFESGSDSRTDNGWAGVLGSTYTFWHDGSDYLSAYVSYRDTFKPAVVDFGPEPDFEILDPEDAQSLEMGFKGRHLDGRFEWDFSLFQMNLHNLVVSQSEDGLPGLTNGGNERFKGAEAEARWNLVDNLSLVGTYAYHAARFADYEQDFDGTLTQLRGNLLEMSPQHLGSFGVIYAPMRGLSGYLVGDYVGKRYLNKRNTVIADSYTTLDAGIGYAFDRRQLRLDGYNLTDRRDPVSESELGDAQYYLLQGRSYFVTARYEFGAR